MLKKFFDRFKSKHDGTLHPCLAAMKHFRPQLSEWKERDEYRLSVSGPTESTFGWGSVERLGLVQTVDRRTVFCYASAGGSTHGQISRQIQAESLHEAFTVMINSNERAEVYYNNYPIGFITPDFSALDLNGNIVMRVTPTSTGLGNGFSCYAPAPFQFASGAHGGFNLPAFANQPLTGDTLIDRYAMGVPKSVSLHDYERRWMIAMWIFLRIGPWSSEEFPTKWYESWSWDPIPYFD